MMFSSFKLQGHIPWTKENNVENNILCATKKHFPQREKCLFELFYASCLLIKQSSRCICTVKMAAHF